MAFFGTEGLASKLRMFRGVTSSNLALLLLAAACGSRQFSRHEAGDAGAPNAGDDGGGARAGKGAGGRGGSTTEQAGAAADQGDGGAPLNDSGGSSSGARGGTGPGGASGGDTNTSGGAANAAGTTMGGNGASAGTVATGGAGGGAGSGAGAASGGRVGSGGRGAAGDAAIAGAGGQPTARCDTQLLVNADFEAGPGAPWQETTNAGPLEIITANSDPKLTAQGVSAHGGVYLAWLGGTPDNQFDSYHVDLWQSVTVPENATLLTLTGAYRVVSDEPTDAVYDETYVQLQDDMDVHWVALHLSNQDQGDTWQTFEEYTTDLDALRGKTLDFYAYSRTDPMVVTSFFLDDLVLTATCGR